MKEINDQLYGYSYELDATSEDNGTKCFAVDTGTVFVAYKGAWYEQPGSLWAASISEGEDDLLGTSWEIGKVVPADDLLVFNAVDTGKRYVSFNGKWYEQPVQWSDPAAGGGGGSGSDLPEVSASDNGDVLTVVEGEWDKAAPSGGSGCLVIGSTYDEATDTYTLDKTWQEIFDAMSNGQLAYIFDASEDSESTTWFVLTITELWINSNDPQYGGGYWVLVGGESYYRAASASDYPVSSAAPGGGG